MERRLMLSCWSNYGFMTQKKSLQLGNLCESSGTSNLALDHKTVCEENECLLDTYLICV